MKKQREIFEIIAKCIVLLVVLGAFSFTLYSLVSKVIPPENRDLFMHTLGMVDTAFVIIVGFYFSSSMGSKDKDGKIKELIDKAKDKIDGIN